MRFARARRGLNEEPRPPPRGPWEEHGWRPHGPRTETHHHGERSLFTAQQLRQTLQLLAGEFVRFHAGICIGFFQPRVVGSVVGVQPRKPMMQLGESWACGLVLLAQAPMRLAHFVVKAGGLSMMATNETKMLLVCHLSDPQLCGHSRQPLGKLPPAFVRALSRDSLEDFGSAGGLNIQRSDRGAPRRDGLEFP